MKTAAEYTRWERMMLDYGYYHRKTINLILHFIGVPVIVTSFLVPFSWIHLLHFEIGPTTYSMNAAWLLVAACGAFYISLDRVLGIFSIPFLAGAAVIAAFIGRPGIADGGIIAAAGFFGGFALQFLGHGLEGKKPALMAYNPLIAMITSPLFVIAELAAVLGIRKQLFAKIREHLSRREAQAAL